MKIVILSKTTINRYLWDVYTPYWSGIVVMVLYYYAQRYHINKRVFLYFWDTLNKQV